MKKLVVLITILFLTGCDTLSLMGQSRDFFVKKNIYLNLHIHQKHQMTLKQKNFLIINLQMMDTFMF
ncbi:hypothetical protein NCZ17_02785 [Acinetobacter modestus]|uniref:hypothetical protein n=1 Tax=Acinetobacter modestus TaxID=1776740 RepID=UPI002030D419|nr:hypothetical protein [Acinetobacter modestus]MCM1958295.1 hypothetical protein [Acinetobacter modestus]